jgi:hypothetical protein
MASPVTEFVAVHLIDQAKYGKHRLKCQAACPFAGDLLKQRKPAPEGAGFQITSKTQMN